MEEIVREWPPDASVGGGRTVLVVDDDHINRRVLCFMLDREGYQTIEAENGSQALESFERDDPDLVLMDVMMPVMDGYAATRAIKARAGDRFVPVLFLTALSDEGSLAECVACGGDDFLVKPYNRTLLKAKIRALERNRALYDLAKTQNVQLTAHNERLRLEQEIAEQTFNKLLESVQLDAPNIRYLVSPVAITNGDLLLATRTPQGRQRVLVGDFTGHGLSAALGAMPVSDVFLSMSRRGRPLEDVAVELNRKLRMHFPTGLFLAACLLEVDEVSGQIAVWNGGMPDVLVARDGAGVYSRLRSQHLPLGVAGDELFETTIRAVSVQPGDRVLAYTDGVLEARNPDGEMFGEQRLNACVTEAMPAGGWFDALRDDLAVFRGAAEQADDLTLIEIDIGSRDARHGPGDGLQGSVDSGGGFSVTYRWTPEMLRRGDYLRTVDAVLATIPGVAAHRGALCTVVGELMANAVDHGLLRLEPSLKCTAEGFDRFYELRENRLAALASGWVCLDLEVGFGANGGSVSVAVEDSGPGFDVTAGRQGLEDRRAFGGRGIALVRSLCVRLDYSPSGRRAAAVFEWDDSPGGETA